MTSPAPKPLATKEEARASTFKVTYKWQVLNTGEAAGVCGKPTFEASSPYRICSPVSASSTATRSSHLTFNTIIPPRPVLFPTNTQNLILKSSVATSTPALKCLCSPGRSVDDKRSELDGGNLHVRQLTRHNSLPRGYRPLCPPRLKGFRAQRRFESFLRGC